MSVGESAIEKVEDQLGIDNLYEAVNTPLVGYLNNALKAKELFKRDKDYVVMDGEVLIVDEFTGRILHGRRYNEGMHQAIEAKECVEIKQENQTLATITLQNYFRLYEKLGGMTGTAATEAAEFDQVYKLGVVPIPTNKDMIRLDQADVVYKTEEAKWQAVVEDIAERCEKGQPVLVGTTSVEKSEILSGLLLRRGVPHEVLNAKYHEKEAQIVAQAGRKGAVTVATNMAGRGTDIMLGGNPEFMAAAELAARGLSPIETPADYEAAWPDALDKAKASVAAEHEEVVSLGGLYVLGTERHESRRIDNQLRGRSGRQGDPGLSRFYLSLDDDLLRIFGPQTMFSRLMNKNLEHGEAIVSPWISKAIETAQKKVEARNYDIRKQVVEFDDVMNDQRKVIYEQRADIMDAETVADVITDMRIDTVQSIVAVNCPEGTYPEQWNVENLKESVEAVFGLQAPIDQWLEEEAVDPHMVRDRLQALADQSMATKLEGVEPERWTEVEKQILLQTLDHHWKEHLATLDALRQVIHLRSYAQKKPIDEYKQEAFLLFERLLVSIREEVTRVLMRAQLQLEPAPPPQLPDFITQHLDPFSGDDDSADVDAGTMGLLSGMAPLSIPQPSFPQTDAEGGVA